MVDIFFALLAASLPVLNAITNKRRRFNSSSPSNPNPVGAAPIDAGSQRALHRSGSDAEVHDFNRYLGRTPEKHHLDDESGDFSGSGSVNSKNPPAPWVELEREVTLAVPTHREKMNNSSPLGGD